MEVEKMSMTVSILMLRELNIQKGERVQKVQLKKKKKKYTHCSCPSRGARDLCNSVPKGRG